MINRVLALSLKFICCTLPFKSSAILQTVSTQSSSLLCLYGTSVFHDHLFTCLKGKDETLIGSLRCSFVCFYVKLLLTKKIRALVYNIANLLRYINHILLNTNMNLYMISASSLSQFCAVILITETVFISTIIKFLIVNSSFNDLL